MAIAFKARVILDSTCRVSYIKSVSESIISNDHDFDTDAIGFEKLAINAEISAEAIDKLTNSLKDGMLKANWTVDGSPKWMEMADREEVIIGNIEQHDCHECGLKWEVISTRYDHARLGTLFELGHNGEPMCDILLEDRIQHDNDKTIREWIDIQLVDAAANGCNVMEELLPMDELFELMPQVA